MEINTILIIKKTEKLWVCIVTPISFTKKKCKAVNLKCQYIN